MDQHRVECGDHRLVPASDATHLHTKEAAQSERRAADAKLGLIDDLRIIYGEERCPLHTGPRRQRGGNHPAKRCADAGSRRRRYSCDEGDKRKV